MNNSQVVIDCDKMKAQNTGLHFFCLHLVNAIQRIAEEDGESISTFAPARVKQYLSDSITNIDRGLLDRFYLRLPDNYKVWHQTFQLGKYMPCTDQKVVLTIHDLNFLYERDQKGLKSGLKRIQHNMDRADSLVAISEFTKQDILAHLDTQGKEIQVIYNGCPIYNGSITVPTDYIPQRPFLFSLGTVLPKKNFHVLPCLLKETDYELVIAGNLSDYTNDIMEEARKWNVAERIHIIGPVAEGVKHWYYQNCSAFMFPSVAEGFGLPVVEAMYYGKPVFLSRHTSLPEIGGEAAIYFNMGFDRELMQEEFQKGMELFQTAITPEAIRAQALKFSWDEAAKEYWKIYKSL